MNPPSVLSFESPLCASMGQDYCLTMDFTLGKRLRDLPGPIMMTGHTGFKGTWLTFLLEKLEVPVVGFSLAPEKDSLFNREKRAHSIPEVFADIRNIQALSQFMSEHQPSAVIHMAAQPLVLESYKTPRLHKLCLAKLIEVSSNMRIRSS